MSHESPTRRDLMKPLLLAVDPADVTKTIDKPVLFDDESADGEKGQKPDAAAPGDPKA